MLCRVIFTVTIIVLLAEKIVAETKGVEKNEVQNKEIGDTDRDKRHVGRWANFRYLLDRKYLQPISDDQVNEDKRHIGRWQNLNWRLASGDAKSKFIGNRLPNSNIGKRFLGRWQNINYLNSLLKANRQKLTNESRPNMEEYRKAFPVDGDLMSELGDINNMDKMSLV